MSSLLSLNKLQISQKLEQYNTNYEVTILKYNNKQIYLQTKYARKYAEIANQISLNYL